LFLLGAFALLFVADHSAAQLRPGDKATAGEIAAAPLPVGAVARPVALTRIGTRLRDQQKVGKYLSGTICVKSEDVYWHDLVPDFVNLKDLFAEELKGSGFKPDAEPGNLFGDTEHPATDLEVGAMLTSADFSACENLVRLTKKIELGVQWQVYSTLRKEVVATIETSASAQQVQSIGSKRDEGRSLGQAAFAANVRMLLSNPQFRSLVTAPDPSLQGPPRASDPLASIVLASAANGPVSMAQATGSVVAVFAGSGFGSGVLVSKDGYLLTNYHVVGTAKTVRLRWSDGLETSGEVVRSDKRRDVALIKAEPRGRAPLAINRNIPPVGAPVFAIGTPLDPGLQSTVTQGIVSATRIVEGFNFIQSDTPVTHGNSGGPLLDKSGAVVGLTDWGVPATEGSTLNFFIPIGDALDFLALKTSG